MITYLELNPSPEHITHLSFPSEMNTKQKAHGLTWQTYYFIYRRIELIYEINIILSFPYRLAQ